MLGHLNKTKKVDYADLLLEHSQDAIIIIDTDYNVVYWNKGAEVLYGVAEKDVLGTSSIDAVQVTISAEEEKKIISKLHNTGTWKGEQKHLKKDGSFIYIHASMTTIKNDKGVVTNYVSINKDITQRVLLEAELKQANEKLEKLVEEKTKTLSATLHKLQFHIDNSPIAIIEWDKHGHITSWSNRATNMFEWEEAEVLGKYFEELHMLPDGANENAETVIKEVFWGDVISNCSVHKNVTKSGKEIYCQWNNSVLRNEKSEIIGSLSFVQDVTAQKLAEEQIRSHEKQLELIYDTVEDVIYLYDVQEGNQFQFVSVNHSFLKVTGLEKNQVVGKYVQEVIPEPSLSLVLQKYHEAIQVRGTVVWEEETPYPNGVKTGVVSVTPIFDSNGNCVQLVGSVHDITERKRVERELAYSENRLRTILDTEPDCIKLLDKECRLIEMNPAGLAMIEADNLEAVKGAPMIQLINPPYRRLFLQFVKEVFNGQQKKIEFEITGFKGTTRWLETNAVPFRNANGEIVAILGVTRDITPNKENEKKLHQLNIRLRELTAHLEDIREEERIKMAREIHDELGQQLTAIKMDVSWVQKQEGVKKDKVLQTKLQETEGLLSNVINTVRQLAAELRPSMIDDLGLQDALQWQAQEFTRRYGIKCSFKTNNDRFVIESKTAIALFRIFQEALTNILRHAQAKSVESRLTILKDSLTLEVADDGIGIDKKKLSNKKTLGLLGMEERALMLNGTFKVTSEIKKGTTITITVPVKKKS